MNDFQPTNPAPLASIEDPGPLPNESVNLDEGVDTFTEEELGEYLAAAMKQVIAWVLEGNMNRQKYPEMVVRKVVALAWFLKVYPFDNMSAEDIENINCFRGMIKKYSILSYTHKAKVAFNLLPPPAKESFFDTNEEQVRRQ